MTIANKLIRYFAFFWILILCLGTFVQNYDLNQHTVFLELKKQAIASGFYLPAFYGHIFGASIILLAGFLQFSKKVQKQIKWHRVLGKIYVFGVLFFAAPGAYVMTFFINRGTGVFISFLIQNTLWIAFTLAAWIYVKNKRIDDHISMMRRSYALAFAAVMLRFYIWLFTIAGYGVSFPNNYSIIAFLSWIPNLIIAEIINLRNKKQLQTT